MVFFLQSCWQVQSWKSAGALGELFNLLRLNTALLPCPSRFAALLKIQLPACEQELPSTADGM